MTATTQSAATDENDGKCGSLPKPKTAVRINFARDPVLRRAFFWQQSKGRNSLIEN